MGVIMKYIHQFLIIITISFMGELLSIIIKPYTLAGIGKGNNILNNSPIKEIVIIIKN